MLDISTLAIGFASAIGLASTLSTDPVVIRRTTVPSTLEWQGYTGDVVGKMFREHLRHIATVVGTMRGDEFGVDYSHEHAFEELMESIHLNKIVDATRDFLNLYHYTIEGQIYNVDNRYHYLLTVETSEEELFYIEVEDGDDIAKLINRTAERFMERVDPYILAQYYRRLETPTGEFPRTKRLLEHCVRVLPQKQTMWPVLVLGNLHYQKGEYEQAITRYLQVIELNPGYSEAMAYWGRTLIAMGYPDTGLQKMRKAVELAADDPAQRRAKVWATVHSLLADELVKRGEYQEAWETYIDGLKLVPENPYLMMGLGKLYLMHKQYDPAIDLLRQAVAKHPEKDKPRALLDKALNAKLDLKI